MRNSAVVRHPNRACCSDELPSRNFSGGANQMRIVPVARHPDQTPLLLSTSAQEEWPRTLLAMQEITGSLALPRFRGLVPA